MKEELVRFVLENGLSPFSEGKSYLKGEAESIFKTRDAKSVHNKVISRISSGFWFHETANLWSWFEFTTEVSAILKRQEFFRGLLRQDTSFLGNLSKPRQSWKPRYGIIAVTEDESTFVKLRELGCASQLLVSEDDVSELERYDIVQVVDCEEFRILLERLPQSVFVNSIDEVYLERYLELLSGWRENFNILRKSAVSAEIRQVLEDLEPMFNLLDNKEGKIITEEEVEKTLEGINEQIGEEIKKMTISGDALMKMLSEGKMPQPILEVVRGSIERSGLSENIFNLQVPVTIDYEELEDQIKRQSSSEFTDLAERVKRNAGELKKIPGVLRRLSALLVVEDFVGGVSKFIEAGSVYPSYSTNLHMSGARNMFLTNAQPISFQLDDFSRCSILTGANSGGKTTLLEHILQNISLFQLGLPIEGEVHMPIFTEVYYFAKNKGSASKGAFETLLTQMSKIKPGRQTLILADEIEAVTEPGVAGKIISATADYFIRKNCFMVLATHLGHEIVKSLPKGARVDGIEAKGLDANFNLIVDHNPVMGRLAHSTPELIVERMANAHQGEYFEYLNQVLKKV
jgi:hypothetical protein